MDVGFSFSKQDTFTEYPHHPKLRSHRLGIVVRIPDGHLLDRIVVGNSKSLGTEWEEVPDDWSIFLVPLALRYADLVGDDGEKLTPQRKARDCRDFAKRGKMERV